MNEGVVKAGTVIRLPITISGFIEVRGLKPVAVLVDRHNWEYAPWPRVSSHGDDNFIMQFDDGPGARRIEGDVELVEPIRVLVDRFMDRGTPWIINENTDEFTDGTE